MPSILGIQANDYTASAGGLLTGTVSVSEDFDGPLFLALEGVESVTEWRTQEESPLDVTDRDTKRTTGAEVNSNTLVQSEQTLTVHREEGAAPFGWRVSGKLPPTIFAVLNDSVVGEVRYTLTAYNAECSISKVVHLYPAVSRRQDIPKSPTLAVEPQLFGVPPSCCKAKQSVMVSATWDQPYYDHRSHAELTVHLDGASIDRVLATLNTQVILREKHDRIYHMCWGTTKVRRKNCMTLRGWLLCPPPYEGSLVRRRSWIDLSLYRGTREVGSLRVPLHIVTEDPEASPVTEPCPFPIFPSAHSLPISHITMNTRHLSPDSWVIPPLDELWTVRVQNSTPTEMAEIVADAKPAGTLARRMALCMGNRFQTQHLLACLRASSDPATRLELLRHTLPLVSDLDAGALELAQALTGPEVLQGLASFKC